MNPADSEPDVQVASLRHAVTSQGAMFGQHDQTLRGIMDSLANLTSGLSRLENQKSHQDWQSDKRKTQREKNGSAFPWCYCYVRHSYSTILTGPVWDSNLSPQSTFCSLKTGRAHATGTPQANAHGVQPKLQRDCIYCGKPRHQLAACTLRLNPNDCQLQSGFWWVVLWFLCYPLSVSTWTLALC